MTFVYGEPKSKVIFKLDPHTIEELKESFLYFFKKDFNLNFLQRGQECLQQRENILLYPWFVLFVVCKGP
jgi:hypothetical protein